MNEKKNILCVIGTRPEAIKMAPVILALKKQPWVKCRVLATAQHRHMLDQVLQIFNIEPDIDFDIMRPNQDLTTLTARILLNLDDVLRAERPSVVLAQGDTTTVMTVALACFYHKIPFGHVEAGLRTGDLDNPFPEEMNRVVAGHLARWHFSPTRSASENLVKEGIDASKISLTGNTVIDSLLRVASNEDIDLPIKMDLDKRIVLVTAHRRENFGQPLARICDAIRTLVENNPDIQVVYPVHPNPNVKETACRVLGGTERIILCDPLEYMPFVELMKRSYLILSDSGGVQEEAPALGIPVLVLRGETERPEAVEEGVVKLVGSDYNKIVTEAHLLLNDNHAYKEMSKGVSPYGDGHAAERIVTVLEQYFHKCD